MFQLELQKTTDWYFIHLESLMANGKTNKFFPFERIFESM